MATSSCPTCGSDDPTRYYGSCFDNIHNTIFDPRLPLDPWHRDELERIQVEKQRVIDEWYQEFLAKEGRSDGDES